MENEVQKNLNENITPFWEYYMPHAREVSERRNENKEFIIKFVDRYNKQFIPIKFQFKEIENCYVWTYEKDSIDLKVTILNVTELAVTLNCEHNGKIKELAKYVAHHVNQRGKFYGKFPVSNGYIFTASDISSSHIYFHLEKDDHHQRIYVMLIQTPFRTYEWVVTRYEDTPIDEEPIVNFETTPSSFKEATFTIEDATKLIKDLPENDIKAYTQGFKILYPNL